MVRRILEEIGKGRDVELSDFIECIHELDGTSPNQRIDDEIKEMLHSKISLNEGDFANFHNR